MTSFLRCSRIQSKKASFQCQVQTWRFISLWRLNNLNAVEWDLMVASEPVGSEKCEKWETLLLFTNHGNTIYQGCDESTKREVIFHNFSKNGKLPFWTWMNNIRPWWNTDRIQMSSKSRTINAHAIPGNSGLSVAKNTAQKTCSIIFICRKLLIEKLLEEIWLVFLRKNGFQSQDKWHVYGVSGKYGFSIPRYEDRYTRYFYWLKDPLRDNLWLETSIEKI